MYVLVVYGRIPSTICSDGHDLACMLCGSESYMALRIKNGCHMYIPKIKMLQKLITRILITNLQGCKFENS